MAGDGVGWNPSARSGGANSAPHGRGGSCQEPPPPKTLCPPLWGSQTAASGARRLRLPGGDFNYPSKYQLIMNRLLYSVRSAGFNWIYS